MKKVLVVMASGLGKTMFAVHDVMDFFQMLRGRVLYLCHNNDILEQAMGEFQSELDDGYSYGLFNGTEKTLHETDFLFASFQTMVDWKDAFMSDEFVYIIVDEAHHVPAPTFRKVANYFKPQFMLSLTATPDRLDKLDLEPICGKEIFRRDLFWGMANGWLSKVDYEVLMDEIGGLESFLDKENRERVSLKELNRRIFIPLRDEKIVSIIKEKSAAKKNPQTIVYCRTIKHAERISALMKGSMTVHCKMPLPEQKANLTAFREGKLKTIVVVDKLNEGIDVPSVDVIVFLRQTVSPVVLHQQLGRGLRLAEGKKSVLVLDFIANVDRLMIIETMTEKARGYVEKSPERERNSEVEIEDRFIVNVDNPKFRERKVDILALIEQARNWHYTKDELITQLQKLAEELGKTPTGKNVDNDRMMADSSTFIHHFGSFNNALLAAGFQPNIKQLRVRRSYSRDELVAQLQKMAEELGRAPQVTDTRSDKTMASYKVFKRCFGSFNNALLAAGFQPKTRRSPRRQPFSRDELLKQLLKKAKSLGRNPKASDVHADMTMAPLNAFNNEFGTFNKALMAAGLPLNSDRRLYTKEEMLDNLVNLQKELGRPLVRKDVNAPSSKFKANSYERKFGKLSSAILAAGLEVERLDKKRTNEELLQLLRDKTKILGRFPTTLEMTDDKAMPTHTTYMDRFKIASWYEVSALIGMEPKKPIGIISDEKALGLLKTFAETLGKTPSISDIDNNKQIPSVAIYYRRFGSFTRACELAGLKPNVKCTRTKKRNTK
jgi:superfamily II DNA or RNA helicase